MKNAIKQSTLMNGINIASIIFVLIILVFNVVLLNLNKSTQKANDERFELVQETIRFMNASAYLTNEVRSFAVTGKKIHSDNYWNEADNLQNTTLSVKRMKEIGITKQEEEKIDEMLRLSDNLIPLEDRAMENIKKGNTAVAIEAVYGNAYEQVIDNIEKLQHEFLEEIESRTKLQAEQMQKKSSFLRQLITGLVMLLVSLQVISMIAIFKKVIRPVVLVKDELHEISEGNLFSNFKEESDTSEIGRLIYSIQEIKYNLNTYIGDIAQKLEQIAANNLNISIDIDYIGDFSPIKDSLTRIIDSLNETLFKIKEAAMHVHEDADKVSAISQNIVDSSSFQTASIDDLKRTLDDISAQFSGSSQGKGNEHIVGFVENIRIKSGEIEKINKVIENIAFQTNILALNAAVEAARAGEAGKGFAVVAEEVRNLAVKSTEATKNTAKVVDDVIREIMETSELQSKAIISATEKLEQISIAARENFDSSKESSQASEMLFSQAKSMMQLISMFEIKNMGAGQIKALPDMSGTKTKYLTQR